MKICRYCLLFLLILVSRAGFCACFFDWSPVSNMVFPNIGEKGDLLITFQLEDLNLPKEESIPISLDFSSARKTSSSMLGYGWFFNIADIALVPNEVNRYTAILPSNETIGMKKIKDGIYKGGDWLLQVKNRRAEMDKSCGLGLSFENGSIIRAKTSRGNILNFKYDGANKLSSIVSGGKTLVKFLYDETNGRIEMVFPGSSRKTVFYFSEVGGYGNMLRKIEKNGEVFDEYIYDFQPNVKKMTVMHGLLKKTYEWSGDGRVSKESFGSGDFYTYSGSYAPDGYFVLKRVLNSTKEEDYVYASEDGLNKRRVKSGPLMEWQMILAPIPNVISSIRYLETKYADGKVESVRYLYDDKGQILREIKNGKAKYHFKRNEKENSLLVFDGDGDLVSQKIMDDRGRVVFQKTQRGVGKFKYLPNGDIEARFENGAGSVTVILDSNLIIKSVEK